MLLHVTTKFDGGVERFFSEGISEMLQLSVTYFVSSSDIHTLHYQHLALTALILFWVIFPSIELPFFHHSLVLFDLFTGVQMSRQRERSGKGLALSKVWMANTVLAAGGGSTLTLKTLNTHCYTLTCSRTHRCHVYSVSLSPEPAAMSSVCMWLWVCVFLCALFCSCGSSCAQMIEDVAASQGWHMALLDIWSKVIGCRGFTASCLQRAAPRSFLEGTDCL